MVQQVKSRTQRRMEKKQAILLVVLLFGISLISFFLGILVGRSGSVPIQPPRDISSTPLPVTPPMPEVVAPPEPAPTPVVTAAKEPVTKREPLTFYDALPKGQNPPLGSGINLPPEVKPATKPEVRPQEVTPAIPVVPVASPISKVATQGVYVVQAASFRKLSDAVDLRDRLMKKGYVVFTQTADLGDKGIWHRVVVGPYSGSSEATRIAARLTGEENLSGMVRKH